MSSHDPFLNALSSSGNSGDNRINSVSSFSACHSSLVKKLHTMSTKILICSLRFCLFSRQAVTLKVSPYLLLQPTPARLDRTLFLSSADLFFTSFGSALCQFTSSSSSLSSNCLAFSPLIAPSRSRMRSKKPALTAICRIFTSLLIANISANIL